MANNEKNTQEQKNIEVNATRRNEPQQSQPETMLPLVDVYQDGDSTYLVAEMPGVSSQDLKVEVDKGILTISGKTNWQEPPEEYARTFVGFTGGEFQRSFALSDEIDRDKITAQMCCGVLKLMLPKAEQAKTRRIEITAD